MKRSIFLTLYLLSLIQAACGQTPRAITPPRNPVTATFFGMHNHEPLNANRRISIDVGTYRLWDADVNWPNLEPRRGQWTWTRLDSIINLAEQRGWQVIVPLAFSPRWASARPNEDAFNDPARIGWSAEPADIADWRDYVRAVVSRYAGRVHIYEVWNEPNNRNFYTGSIAALIQLQREAYTIVKEIDPNATVVSPAVAHNAGTGLTYFDRLLSQGIAPYIDVVAYHFYIDADPPESLPDVISTVQRMMTQRGVGSKPLWNTEASWAADHITFPSEEIQAAWLARAYLLNWAAGVGQLDWYSWDNRVYPSIYMLEADLRTPAAPATAYAQVRRWMLGSRMASAASDPSGFWIVALNRPDNTTAYAVWKAEGAAVFTVPGSWRISRVSDLNGRSTAFAGSSMTIGQSPVLLEAPNVAPYSRDFAGAVSAASIVAGPVAPNSLVTLFAEGFEATTASATYQPLFETLGSATVHLRDATGASLLSKLSYAGHGQVNLLLPEQTAEGAATLTAIGTNSIAYSAPLEVRRVAPSLFTANADGKGVAAAYAVIADFAGNQTVKYTFQCGSVPGQCEPDPIPASGNGRSSVLVLYGTGIRNAAPASVRVALCGQTLTPSFVGAHSVYAGLDQLNVPIPSSMRGCGSSTLTLTAGGIAANPVTVAVE